MKCLRQYERIKLKHYKLEQNTEFLRICLIYNVLPKFIRYKPYNTRFKRTRKYQELGRSMLYNIYTEQLKRLKKLNNDVTENGSCIKNIVSYPIMTEIVIYIDKLIHKEKEIIHDRHNRKFQALNIPVNQAEESLLSKGWKYAINLNKFNNLNLKVDIEYMYYFMDKNLLLKNTDNANKVKAALDDFGSKLKKKVDEDIPNLSSEELNAISTLLNEYSLVISKVDKGNVVVVMNKSDYLFKANEILNDKRAFKNLTII
ncbi:unnamed protein product [Rotaria socialis]|uniref:Uncharacterized protein n=1 Tax=Rotaria socialis TaxID=392032 RepID=A0A821SPD1_9BILA|nr:unnamed protein product [Rotaria socialis]CAF4861575.1 unnamed protein product [Rotaria socialis]